MKVLLFLVAFLPFAFSQCATYTTDTRQLSGIIRDVWGCGDPALPGSMDLKLPYPACGSLLNAGEPTPVCASGGPWRCAQDFERWEGDDLGIPQIRLGSNGVPVYNNSKAHPSIYNTTQFASWYVDDKTFNVPFTLSLSISNAGTCNSLIYQYNNQNFYPIDGRGFGNFYNSHNYHFTFNSNLRFTYQGFEVFDFVGDDDVWVFIDGWLALDLGGVHGAESIRLDLTYPSAGCSGYTIDRNNLPLPCVTKNGASSIPCACILNLQKGTSYAFALFYNERHIVASDLKFTTSLFLQCPFTDHCGVCQGNGQSCCTCVSPDKCHTASCNVTTGACIYTPTTCPAPADACHTVTCNPNTGNCDTAAITCNDNSACTNDSCDPAIGCQFITFTCNDNNPCTADSCNPTSGCVFTNISGCNPLCVSKVCPAGDACVQNSCDPNNGSCVSTYTVCNDNNMCTIDSCNPTSGCNFTTRVCNDNDPCTIDTCNSTTGCVFTPKNCDDKNACTNDTCIMGTCNYTAIAVPAGNLCDGVFCDPNLGIIHVPTQCPSACKATCDPNTGCSQCPGGATDIVIPVTIGAGVIAAIVIGVVAFLVIAAIGSKKGYEAYMRNKNTITDAKNNPLYKDAGRTGNNPFYRNQSSMPVS